jgi:ATP-dependent helicase/nuclease subunit A
VSAETPPPGDTPLGRIARFERDLLVQAGAGTGKTHALVTLYLHLVGGLTAAKCRTAPSRIAVVTFTDKAAGELKERLRLRLAALVATPRRKDEPTLAEAARELKAPLPGGEVWLAALAQLGGAPVGTFHSFAGALLRRNAAAAGIDPDFTLLDQHEASQLATEAAERAVLDGLEKSDAAAIELVAEYGYHGVARSDRLVEHLVRLRAARAEEGRDEKGLEAGHELGPIEEALAAARQELRAEISSLEAKLPSVTGKQLFKARDCVAQLAGARDAADVLEIIDLLSRQTQVLEHRDAIRDAAKKVREAEAGLRAVPLARALSQLVAATERNYAAAKKRAGVLDFTDLLVLARDLLRDDAEVRNATRARFDAVLVDEFQDTNPVQAELIELVSGPPGESGRRFVVGDRKQSIYEFRGADVAVFTRTSAELLARGGREELLQVCRRALPKLLQFDNALFARVMAAPPGGTTHDWALSYQPERDDLSPFREGDGLAELITVAKREKSEDTRAAEAKAIAARLHQLHQAGRRWGDCAILLRRFTALGDYLEALRSAQVPHYVVRGRGFFAAQEVRDLASALALLDDPDDTLALVSVLRSPLVGVSDETLTRLALTGRISTWGNLPQGLPDGERQRLEEFRSRFDSLRRAADRLGPTACVRALIDDTDLAAVLATTREGEQRVANLERLVERARAFENQGGDLREFVAWLKRVSAPGAEVDLAQAQVVDEHDDVVRVMTVHQAKGLEFPIVFVPGCGNKEPVDHGVIRYDAEEGLGLRVHDEKAPSAWLDTAAYRRVKEARAARRRAESLRLFYVAATRAKDVVIFSGELVRGAGDSWRTQLDGVAPELLLRTPGDDLPPPPQRKDNVQFSLFADGGAEKALAQVDVRPAPRPRELTAAVTQLADFALCPRRYLHFHALGLAEHPAAARAPSLPVIVDSYGDGDAPPLDALRRGTLAHRLLERCRFDQTDDLNLLLQADGYDPAETAVAEVREHVARFVATPFARSLAGRALRRELPFLLSIPFAADAHLYVRGQIDLLLLDSSGVTVLDYKHARAGDDDDYRFQLAAYALAARRLYPSAPSVSVGLVFLKESDPEPKIQLAPPSQAFEAELAQLGGALAAARSSDAWPGRPIDECRAIRCGYVYRCHQQ